MHAYRRAKKQYYEATRHVTLGKISFFGPHSYFGNNLNNNTIYTIFYYELYISHKGKNSRFEQFIYFRSINCVFERFSLFFSKIE